LESYQTSHDRYRAIREHAATGEIEPRGQIALSGKDRASYLQGLLTNDIQALAAGSGCYSAWLTPQGRMLTDMHVFESGDMILLDVPAGQVETTLQRLDQFLFSEDVQLAGLAGSLRGVWIHGPAAARLVERTVTGLGGRNLPPEGESHTTESHPAGSHPTGSQPTESHPAESHAAGMWLPASAGRMAEWPDYHNERGEFAGAPAVVARVDQLGVPGFCIYVAPQQETALLAALHGAGAVAADADALEAARIEAGYPLFGVDMTEDTIPLEAAIEPRAISLTKGCYVGQEVIIRVLHRGHGRVAKKLVALRVDGDPPARGAKLFAGEREVGHVTSAAASPRYGAIALGYLHRDFLAPGTAVDVDAQGARTRATVSERPIPPAA
jgi:folate-binding protein YgfZ